MLLLLLYYAFVVLTVTVHAIIFYVFSVIFFVAELASFLCSLLLVLGLYQCMLVCLLIILLLYTNFFTGAALSAVPAGVLYAQTGPQPSPMAGFSLVTQPIHYQTAALNAAVKTSSSEQTATTEQVTSEQQQQQQTQQQQQQSQSQAQQQQATQQADGTEIQAVQNITFATGNTFPAGSYAGIIPATQAYGNAYMTQQQGVAGEN